MYLKPIAARRLRGDILLVVGLACAGPTIAARADDPFETLNLCFRNEHAAAREREWARRGPVILVEFEKLTLIRGEVRDVAVVIPAQYHHLKSIAHGPIAVYLALSGADDGPPDERLRNKLNLIASQLEAAEKALPTAKFAAATHRRQEEILNSSTTFVRRIIEAGIVDNKRMKEYATAVAPLLMKNLDEAAALQIRGYDDQTAAWKKSLTPDERKSLKVVVVGSALPRKRNLAVQYFARVLGVPGENERLVYAESLYDEPKAIKLMNAIAVDAGMGEMFFNDSTRLHRDLMDQAAEKYLTENAAELRGIR